MGAASDESAAAGEAAVSAATREEGANSKDLQQQSKALDKFTDRIENRHLDSYHVGKKIGCSQAPRLQVAIRAARPQIATAWQRTASDALVSTARPLHSTHSIVVPPLGSVAFLGSAPPNPSWRLWCSTAGVGTMVFVAVKSKVIDNLSKHFCPETRSASERERVMAVLTSRILGEPNALDLSLLEDSEQGLGLQEAGRSEGLGGGVEEVGGGGGGAAPAGTPYRDVGNAGVVPPVDWIKLM
ncbi:hypothetical protein ABZP36_020842 [Zizania latifolia]